KVPPPAARPAPPATRRAARDGRRRPLLAGTRAARRRLGVAVPAPAGGQHDGSKTVRRSGRRERDRAGPAPARRRRPASPADPPWRRLPGDQGPPGRRRDDGRSARRGPAERGRAATGAPGPGSRRGRWHPTCTLTAVHGGPDGGGAGGEHARRPAARGAPRRRPGARPRTDHGRRGRRPLGDRHLCERGREARGGVPLDRPDHDADDVRGRVPAGEAGPGRGAGLFHVIRAHCPRWILYPALAGVLIGNTIEAAADLGGMAAALHFLLPIPPGWLVVGIGTAIVALQLW